MARQVNTILQPELSQTGEPLTIETPYVAAADPFGNPIDENDTLQQILQIQKKQLAVLRALLMHFNATDTLPQLEEDFYNLD